MPKFYLKFASKKIWFALIGILLISNLAVWHTLVQKDDRTGDGLLTVAFLDIGQGDAIFIEAPNGNQIIVDGGPNAKILSEIGALMPWYDKSIDMIVITNPDKDHIAGFVDVLKRYDVDRLLEPGTENKSLVNNEVHELAATKKVETLVARRGMNIVLDAQAHVTLTVLFPDRDVSKESSNDGSMLMRLVYGETEVMLTGDAPSTVEKYLLSLRGAQAVASSSPGFQLESDILKVGHHGSKTSTSPEFVRAVNPQFAVISSGKENKYGHPTQEVLDILGGFPLEILRTDTLGTIVMKSDGKKFWREE